MPPFSPEQWQAINALGLTVDHALSHAQVNLTMGGEPTYVSAGDRESMQWHYDALGADKRRIAGVLLGRLQQRFVPTGSLRHYGLGKLYPGEAIYRWALGCFWRLDGVPLWRNAAWLTVEGKDYGHTAEDAKAFMTELLLCLAIPVDAVIPAYEDGAEIPTGYVLPFLTVEQDGQPVWASCPWEGLATPGELRLLPGTSPIGMRLPLGDLSEPEAWAVEATPTLADAPIRPEGTTPLASPNSIQLALGVEVQQGTLRVFLPPIATARSFADLLTAIEATAESLGLPVLVEGYAPPGNQGIQGFQITPDPGVIEVNIHPAATWGDLVTLHTALDEEALACGLSCEKFALDGRRLGTGGGSHITLGGVSPEASPLLRRPDLLRSFITYWQHHPSLSYLFSSQFIGPTSQSPRVDEGRHDSLYELEMAFLTLLPRASVPPEVIDRLLRPLLVDVSGNAHRTALCIDKLFPTDNPRLQLGLLEFRGFEMPPTAELRLLQMLLVRSLVAWFWQHPFTQPLKRFGAELRDRYLLPHDLGVDFQQVLADLAAAGYGFDPAWFTAFWEQRFPRYGQVSFVDNPARVLELRTALEPWPVLGDLSGSGTSRPVDNSLERLQIKLMGVAGDSSQGGDLASRYAVLCNGHRVPMRSTGQGGEYVGGVRFRARAAMGGNHRVFAPHAPLTIAVFDTWQGRFMGGAVYHVQSPDGNDYADLPVTGEAASARFAERFEPLAQAAVPAEFPPVICHPEAPLTLDLRMVSQKTVSAKTVQ